MSDTNNVSPLRQRMIEDMAARQPQSAHAAQPHLQAQAVPSVAQTLARYGNAGRGAPISALSHRKQYEHLQPQSDHDRDTIPVPRHVPCHDLAAEVWHIKEPQKLPTVVSPEEVKRVLTMATK